MEEIIKALVDKAKTNKAVMNTLKSALIEGGDYENAAKLRELELDLFGELDKESQEYKDAKEFQDAMRMVEIKVDIKVCYLINEVKKALENMGEKFDIKTSSKIIAEADKIFG